MHWSVSYRKCSRSLKKILYWTSLLGLNWWNKELTCWTVHNYTWLHNRTCTWISVFLSDGMMYAGFKPLSLPIVQIASSRISNSCWWTTIQNSYVVFVLAKKQNLNKIPKNNLREKIFDVDNIFNLPHHLEPQTMLISSQPGRDEHQIFHQVKTTHKSECQNLKKTDKNKWCISYVFLTL